MNSKTLRLGMYSSTLNAYGNSMLFWKGINNVPNVHTACHPIHDVIRMIRIANITFARTLAINAFTVNRIAQKMHSYVSCCAVNASVASKQRDATCYPRCSKANDVLLLEASCASDATHWKHPDNHTVLRWYIISWRVSNSLKCIT